MANSKSIRTTFEHNRLHIFLFHLVHFPWESAHRFAYNNQILLSRNFWDTLYFEDGNIFSSDKQVNSRWRGLPENVLQMSMRVGRIFHGFRFKLPFPYLFLCNASMWRYGQTIWLWNSVCLEQSLIADKANKKRGNWKFPFIRSYAIPLKSAHSVDRRCAYPLSLSLSLSKSLRLSA